MISICIVNYKTSTLTENAIKSVINNLSTEDFEILLIDNHSGSDDVKALHKFIKTHGNVERHIKFRINNKNLGFSKANNQAMKVATGDYIALLNSDTELTTDSLSKAVAYLDANPDVGAVGCRLITPDGRLDEGCKRGFPTPKASLFYFLKLNKLLRRPELDLYKLSHLDEYKIYEVDVISGAFMVLPRRIINEVGMLDEGFFMYGEDIDWCYRIRQAGYKIVYNPELGDAIHHKGASGKKRKFKTLFNFYEAMFLFYNKHYAKEYNVFITLLVYLGIVLQFLLKLVWNYRPRIRK